MNSRLIVPLLGAAALAFACGPHGSRSSEAAAGAPPVHARHHKLRPGESPIVAPALAVRAARGGAGEVEFALDVVNASDHRVELSFPDGRTHDFVVLDSAGREVWRWSRARMFTQALQVSTLQAGDTLAYAERWARPAAAHGRFTAVALVASDNYPIERRQDFTLP